jgi:DHA2 family multidrug resistance protein-like MFS transporter
MVTVRSKSRRWWALGALSLSVLAVSLDATVLSVALPTLAKALPASESDLEWFSSGYLLLLAAAVLPAGLVGDRYGRKLLLLASLSTFGAGSVLCALASSSTMFLVARLLVGVAGAGVTVMALAALTVLFPDERERSRAVGIWAAANFLALPLGPILGGWMLSRFWWGWVFLINVPVAVIGLIVGIALIPESRSPEPPAFDLRGIAASVAGLVLLGGLVLWERRLAARGGAPLIDPSLFATRSFTWGAILGGVTGLPMIGLLFVMPQYFQAVQGADSLHAGLRLLPLVAGLVLTAATATAIAELSERRSGVGSAVVQAIQKTSAPLGAAIIGSVLSAAYQSGLHLHALSPASVASVRGSVYAGTAIARQTGSTALLAAVRSAFVHGIGVALTVSVAVAVVGAILALMLLPPIRPKGHSSELADDAVRF